MDRIKERAADGWYVSVPKDATNLQKERLVQQANALLKLAAARYPTLSKDYLLIALMM